MDVVAAAALSVASVSAVGLEPFEDLLEDGSRAAEQGRYEEALASLSASYDAMPRLLQLGELGRFAVEQALQSFDKGPRAEADVATALALLDRYFRNLESARNSNQQTLPADAVEDRLLRRRTELAARLDGDANDPKPPPPVQASPPHELTLEPTPFTSDGDGREKSRPISIALLSVGSILAAGSIPLLVQGIRYPSLVDAKEEEARAEFERLMAEDPSLTIDESAWAEHEAQQRRIGYALTGVGAGMLVVGAALAIWGGVRLAKGRTSSLTAHPTDGVVFRF